MAEQLILIVGFGSIGRRHIRNLLALGCSRESLIVYRSGKSTLPDDELEGIKVETDLSQALSHHPTAVVIANPTAFHLPLALEAANAGCHILLEKPISHSMEGINSLAHIIRDKNLVVLVGFQFRFHPALLRAKQLLQDDAIGEIVSVQAHWGEYLPDWHPWEDYHSSYSANAELGGGVVLTLCHPFDYLRWLVGDVSSVHALTRNKGGLGIAVEDTADVLLDFKNNATGYVHLDYIQRPSSHWFQIIGQSGTLRWDSSDNTLRWYRAIDKAWASYTPPRDFERNSMFMDEMRHFLACINGTEFSRCTLDDGIAALQLALNVKQTFLSSELPRRKRQ